MAVIDFKNAAGRVSFNAGMTEDGKLIRKTKTYQHIARHADADSLYQGLGVLAGLSAYLLIEVEVIETSVVSN